MHQSLIEDLFNICNNQNYFLSSSLDNFMLDKLKRNFIKKGISYSGAKFWNNHKNDPKSKTTNCKD